MQTHFSCDEKYAQLKFWNVNGIEKNIFQKTFRNRTAEIFVWKIFMYVTHKTYGFFIYRYITWLIFQKYILKINRCFVYYNLQNTDFYDFYMLKNVFWWFGDRSHSIFIPLCKWISNIKYWITIEYLFYKAKTCFSISDVDIVVLRQKAILWS